MSQGTLAGAIAGPVLALLLVVAIGVVWWRKRRRAGAQTANEETELFEKPMLHSDHVLKQVPLELGGGVPAHELEGDIPAPTEVVGSEVLVQELPESENKDGKTGTKGHGGGEES
ncbi:hypothetical protein IMZ48_44055 [Candidatus Bathyarchaeota archaeon]|nr:hypothetical protein [Candidatus Bathyarchaeota archaeon]